MSVLTTSAATAADAAAFQNDPSQSYASINDYNALSPDPAAPLPYVSVKFTPPGPPHLLPGSIQSLTMAGAYVEDAQVPVWEGTIANAVKHAAGGGASLAGLVAYGPAWPDRNTTDPEIYAPLPDPAEYSAAPLPQSMAIGTVQMQFQLGLPAQYSGASVTVADAAGGQRVVTVQFNQAAGSFADDNLEALAEYVDSTQTQLDDPLQGANIGLVVVKSQDPGSGSPLFTHAADTTWGQRFDWSAPSVKAFTEPVDPDNGS